MSLEIRGVTKRFGALVANDAISLSVAKGEILALLGENGAGKTTLMNILFGHYMADEGEILVDGTPLRPGDTGAAIAAGVGMVHQHFALADNMTVLENITLGTEPLWSWRADTAAARRRIVAMAEAYGLSVDPDRRVDALSIGEKQRVEILKALYRDARILILDEPTSVLTPQESDRLFETLKAMTAEGLSIIFITHKLHEILAVSDRVAVLRRGAVVGTVATATADRESLAELMVGHKVARPRVEHLAPGEPVVELDAVTVVGPGGAPLLDRVSFAVRAREIVGLAGVAGNGQSALAALLSGMLAPSAGAVRIDGETVRRHTAREFIRRRVGRIPEDRHATGVVGDFTVWENLIGERLREAPLWRWGRFVDFAACRAYARRLVEQYDIRGGGIETLTRLLSGGNMQKLILARTLDRGPRFILASQPIRGLDEGAIAAVHQRLLDAKRDGAAVLVISEDLDEILAIADRVVVIHGGRTSPALDVRDADARRLGLMMAGDLGHGAPVRQGGAAA